MVVRMVVMRVVIWRLEQVIRTVVCPVIRRHHRPRVLERHIRRLDHHVVEEILQIIRIEVLLVFIQ